MRLSAREKNAGRERKKSCDVRREEESDARAAQLKHFGLLRGLGVRVRQRRRRALFAHDAEELAAAALAAVLVARPDADQLSERREENIISFLIISYRINFD